MFCASRVSSRNSSRVIPLLLIGLVLALLCFQVESSVLQHSKQKQQEIESRTSSLATSRLKTQEEVNVLWRKNNVDRSSYFLSMLPSFVSEMENVVTRGSNPAFALPSPFQFVAASSTPNPTATPNPSGPPVVHSTPSPSPGMAYLFIKILLRSFITEEISKEIELDLADAANVPVSNLSLVNFQVGPILTYVLEAERQLAPSLVQSLTFYIKSGQLAASINNGPIILVDDPIEFSESGQSVNESQVAPALRSTPLPTAGFHRVLYEIRFNNFTTNIFTAAINNDIEDVLAAQLSGMNVSDILLTNLFNCSGKPPYVLADYITVFASNETNDAINKIYKFVNSGAMQNLTHLDVIMIKMPKTMESLLQTSSSPQPVGAIVGGTVGGVIGVLIIIGLILFVFYLRRRRRKKFLREESDSTFEKFGMFPQAPQPAWLGDSDSPGLNTSNGFHNFVGHNFFYTVHKIDEDLDTVHSSNGSWVAGVKWEGATPFDTDKNLTNANNIFGNGVNEKSDISERSSDLLKWSPSHSTKDTKHDAPWEIPFEELTLMHCVGVGGFGIVYSGLWHGTQVAVKKLLDQDLTENQIEEFRAEAKMMARLRHPNIVLFLGATTCPPNLSIVTELMTLGSLYKVLHGSTKTHRYGDENSEHASGSSSSQSRILPLSWRQRVFMCIDAARGLNYLHQHHPPIVHRDLKSLNLLVSENLTVKVSDFGLSRVRNRTFLTSRHCGGTPEWTAPEVLRSEQHNEKADVYSFGVIMWEMITRKVPFEGMTSMQIIAAVGFRKQKLPPPLIPSPLPPNLSGMHRYVDVMESCFAEPDKRPSMSHILSELCKIVQSSDEYSTNQPPLRKNFSSSVAETARTSSPSLRRILTDNSYDDMKHPPQTPTTASIKRPLQRGPKDWMQLAPLDLSELEF
ncbi:Serine/threonine-protein kinase EDR1 [Galdieria sulphuraria]|uniref:non-specific serine/threonine protein kinase n=1 Tax=Galdieria sulphuraria TaxID=130081 RepID=M2XBV6_GALSU|nr:serine/threonine protein kinase [Galdieria sulphuraria]EME27357.1 serine/threonine protein kinase [Galdieria sulphuraria]GJD09512.1 Serine/threonine-protein kinase EDR1 [Galdieria sulphuraria]|eukprot:XP_005703877.1 serine/threonine protein kinase [Galdieria sulphuraria]